MTRIHSLHDMELFVRVVELGNMSEVARQLNITNAAVSAAIKRLELAYGVNLLERTTRRLQLSAAGHALIPFLRQAFQALEDADAQLRSAQSLVAGELSIGLPSDVGRNLLLPILDRFQELHPSVAIRLSFSDLMHDLYRENLDLVIRYGALKDSSLVAKKLCNNERVLAAAPAYLERVAPPTRLEDLANHNCLYFYRHDRPYTEWVFYREGQRVEVSVKGDRYADDGDVVRRWALAGTGIIYKSALDLADDFRSARLVPLLEGYYQGQPAPLFAVYKHRKYQPHRLTALLQHLESNLRPQ